MFDGAGEARQHRFDVRQRRAVAAGIDHLALAVEGIGLLAEADGEVIGLGRVEHAAGELGCLAERDRQHARRQRVERAAVADLGLGLAGLPEDALDRRNRLGRA